MCGILFSNGSLNRELVSFFAFLNGLRFKGDFVGYEQRYSWSPVLSTGMKYLFASPPFQSIGVFTLGWACLGSRLKVFALVPNLALCVFWWQHSVLEQFTWSLIDVSWLPFEALFSRWFYVSLSSFFSFGWMGSVPLILCWSPFLFRFLNVVVAFGLGLPCFVFMLTPSFVCSL